MAIILNFYVFCCATPSHPLFGIRFSVVAISNTDFNSGDLSVLTFFSSHFRFAFNIHGFVEILLSLKTFFAICWQCSVQKYLLFLYTKDLNEISFLRGLLCAFGDWFVVLRFYICCCFFDFFFFFGLLTHWSCSKITIFTKNIFESLANCINEHKSKTTFLYGKFRNLFLFATD